nr:transketolase [Bacteriovorax sp. HI3]
MQNENYIVLGMKDISFFKEKSKQIRKDIVHTAFAAQKGHIPSAFSMIEILVMLYYQLAKITPEMTQDRDRIILSKGHGCLGQYAILADLNFFPKEELLRFCSKEGILGGHPSRKVPGIEVSTGSLGHGPSLGIGMALTNKNSNIFVIVGDGECNEGSVWEAALAANKHQLDNFWIIVDYNKYQSYDHTQVICPLDDLKAKWQSFGFQCEEIDTINSPYSFMESFARLQKTKGPKCIVSHSIKGLGAKALEGNLAHHHLRSMSEDFRDQLLMEIDCHA